MRMIKAGTLMGYSDQQILSSIRTGYKDPYHTSVITKAKRKDINIDIPSYDVLIGISTITFSVRWNINVNVLSLRFGDY